MTELVPLDIQKPMTADAAQPGSEPESVQEKIVETKRVFFATSSDFSDWDRKKNLRISSRVVEVARFDEQTLAIEEEFKGDPSFQWIVDLEVQKLNS